MEEPASPVSVKPVVICDRKGVTTSYSGNLNLEPNSYTVGGLRAAGMPVGGFRHNADNIIFKQTGEFH